MVRAQLLSQTLDCSESLSVEYTVANQPEMTDEEKKFYNNARWSDILVGLRDVQDVHDGCRLAGVVGPGASPIKLFTAAI